MCWLSWFSGPWFWLPPWSRSFRLFPWATILLYGPLDIAWICCPQLPHHPCKKRDAQHMFLQHRGAHAERDLSKLGSRKIDSASPSESHPINAYPKNLLRQFFAGALLNSTWNYMRIKFRPPPPTPEFLSKDFLSATRSRTEILTKENLVRAKIALTALSRTFTPLVRRIRFP